MSVSPSESWDLLVFREGKRSFASNRLCEGLLASLSAIAANRFSDQELALGALLRAGELESGVADAALSDPRFLVAAETFAQVTDLAASLLVGIARGAHCQLASLYLQLQQISLPQALVLTAAEGFAYYALHPLDYVVLVRELDRERLPAAIVGIRSIGTTLSAMVAATFRSIGRDSQRTTIRPVGHPFDRTASFSPEQQKWIREQRDRGATFFVVDEGPGLSGSSFLSVVDALMRVDIPAEKITILCSHPPKPELLKASRAVERWRSVKARNVRSTGELPSLAKLAFSGGTWRSHVFKSEAEWPGCWLHNERLKFLSPEKKHSFKFDGLGHYGQYVFDRYKIMSEMGFSPEPVAEGSGFNRFEMLSGKPMNPAALSGKTIDRLAEYCAARAVVCSTSATDSAAVIEMAKHNIATEFQSEACIGELPQTRPVIADAKMMAYEWVQTPHALMKLDCASHGDDHFYPGPTDIAWDLAGAIVEWQMDPAGSDYFLRQYERHSGDDARWRIREYKIAYLAFRMAYCKLGSQAMRGTCEESRLWRDYRFYRNLLERGHAIIPGSSQNLV